MFVITPLTLWHLGADESGTEAEGVGEAKECPTRTKFSVEGGECSEIRQHDFFSHGLHGFPPIFNKIIRENLRHRARRVNPWQKILHEVQLRFLRG
jgi:hypothetical protein